MIGRMKNSHKYRYILLLLSLAGGSALLAAPPQAASQVTRLGNYGDIIAQTPVYTPAPDLNYLQFMPTNTEAMIDGKFPLLISLSGIGERGSDLNKLKQEGLPEILDGWNGFPFIVLSPQCPPTTEWYYDRTDTLIRRMIVRAIAELPVDPERIYLTGYSMGGIACWDMGARYPDLFAAIIPVAARREAGPSLCNMRDIPVWAFHGANDAVVPLALAQGAINIFRNCGGKAKFTVYPGVGHDSWTQTYANMDVYEWLLKQSRRRTIAVAAMGSIVYQGRGRELAVLRYEDTGRLPQTLAAVPLPENIAALNTTRIAGHDHLTVLGDSTFWLFGIANPASPTLISSIPAGSQGTGCAMAGEIAFLALGDGGVKILDISDPLTPQLLTALDTLGHCYDVFADIIYLYVAAGEKIHILDISDPATPVHLGMLTVAGMDFRAVAADGDIVYAGDEHAGLLIADVHDPANPAVLGMLDTGEKTTSIRLRDNLGFITTAGHGLRIIDRSNPGVPVELAGWASPGRAMGLAFGEVAFAGSGLPHIFIADYSAGVRAVAIADPSAPVESSYLQVAAPVGGGVSVGKAYRACVIGQTAYIAYGWEGLKIVDVADPQQPELLGKLDTPGDARDVRVPSNIAYVADWDPGLRVVDVSDLQQPGELSVLRIGRTRQLALEGGFLYAAAGDSGFVILDAADPADPLPVAVLAGYYGRAVAVDGTIAALADQQQVWFFDVSDPAQPSAGGSTGPLSGGGCDGLVITGQHAYITDGDTLRIFDLTNLAAPLPAGKTALGATGYDVAVQLPYAAVAAGTAGLRIYDISDVNNPQLAGYYDGEAFARGVAMENNLLYVSEENDGLSIYRFEGPAGLDDPDDLPAAYSLQQNFPNPFNPQTEIRYRLPVAGRVTLEVFNLLGQKVATLTDRLQPAGEHRVIFRADGLGSGIYFYRLRAGNFESAKKMLLIQ